MEASSSQSLWKCAYRSSQWPGWCQVDSQASQINSPSHAPVAYNLCIPLRMVAVLFFFPHEDGCLKSEFGAETMYKCMGQIQSTDLQIWGKLDRLHKRPGKFSGGFIKVWHRFSSLITTWMNYLCYLASGNQPWRASYSAEGLFCFIYWFSKIL